MFDLATRPQPSRDPAVLAAMPFDWRLTRPTAPRGYPWTDYLHSSGAPQPGQDVLATYAVALEDTLSTAVVISLFTDRRAGRDDALPLGRQDRGGWVGEEFVGLAGRVPGAQPDEWGSALWLLYTSKVTPDILDRARFAAQEALQWLIRDGIASRVDVQTLWAGEDGDRLAVRPTIYRPGQVSPVYDVLWGTSIRRWTA